MSKEGENFIRHMFEFAPLSVNIKVDQMSFNQRVDFKGNFFPINRNGNADLRFIDYVANDNYGKAAKMLEHGMYMHPMNEEIPILYWNNEYYFEYFPEQVLPTYLKYDFVPLSRLVFSYRYCKKLDLRFPDKKSAAMFGVENTPTLLKFEHLDKVQIDKIIHWLENPTGEFIDFVRDLFPIPNDLEKFLPENKIEGLVFFNIATRHKEYQVFKMIDPKYESWKRFQDGSIEQHQRDVFNRLISAHIFEDLENNVDQILSNFSSGLGRNNNYLRFIGELTNHLLNTFSDNISIMTKSVVDQRFANLDIGIIKDAGVNCDFLNVWYGQDFYRMLMFWLSQDRKQVSFRSGIGKKQVEILNNCVKKLRNKGLIK